MMGVPQTPTLSSRHLLPGSSAPRTPLVGGLRTNEPLESGGSLDPGDKPRDDTP